jgi:transposase-like protein
MKPISFKRHRFPPEIIRHAVWLYARFTLSFRDVEELLAERALSEQNSKYLERPSNRSDRPGKLQENQWPRNPVLTLWQSKRICSDNAIQRAQA